jgi:hypothetical protein
MTAHLPHLIFDLEGNGLYDQCTKLHCGVTKDILTGEVRRFRFEYPGDIINFTCHLRDAAWLCAHNGIDYDFPIMKKLWGWEPREEQTIVDTLVMSRLLNPDREPVAGVKAPHSVEAWGKRFGRWKPEIEDWSTYTPEMLHRCAEDVEIQHMIFERLIMEAGLRPGGHDIFGQDEYESFINWSQALRYEHRSAMIFREQQENGVYFEKEQAIIYTELLDKLIDKLTIEISSNIPPKPKQHGVSVNEPFKKNGDYKKTVLDWYDGEFVPVCGPFSRVRWDIINLNSDVQLKNWLYSIGWEPDEWNYHKTEVDEDGNKRRTSPKVTEASIERLEHGLSAQLSLRSKAAHRRNQIAGWIGNTRRDHRIQAEANPQGTPTGRARHRIVANVPKVSVYENKEDKDDPKNGQKIWYPEKQNVFFGTEMRSLFSAGPDSNIVLVGRDATGIELRCFAHYVNDKKYTNIILNEDIHSYHQEMAGLATRDMAKTFIYAFLYGAGDEKIGSIVMPDGTKAEKIAIGKELKAQFMAANPKLDKLVKGVKKASRRGFLIGIDGRKLMMRVNKQGRIAENKALNTLLQGADAQIMTYARVWLYDKVKEHGWSKDCIKVLDYHDEETYQSTVERSEDLKEVMIQSVVEAGLHYNFNLPLAASAEIGKTWAEIH